jgi:hypothetical protein
VGNDLLAFTLAGAALTGIGAGILLIVVSVNAGGPSTLAVLLGIVAWVWYRCRRWYRREVARAAQQALVAERAAMLSSVEEQFPAGWTGEVVEYRRVVRR